MTGGQINHYVGTSQPEIEPGTPLFDESLKSCGSEGNRHVLVRRHEEKMKSINADLQGIKDLLLIDDTESLVGRADGLKKFHSSYV